MNYAADHPPIDVTMLIQEGKSLFEEGNLVQARRCFESIVASDHQNFEALNNLGVIHFTEGNSQQAIHCFNMALKIHDGYFEALENLATCLANGGDYTGAAQIFEKIVLSVEQKPETFIAMINCQIHCGEFVEAKSNIKRLARLHGHLGNIKNIVKQIAQDLNDALHSGKYPVEKIITYYLEGGNLAAARDFLIPALNHNPDLQNLKDLLIKKEKIKRLPITILSAADLLENDPARKLRWGDYWFKKELADALSDEGAVIATGEPKVRIHLHGIPIEKPDDPAYNILWIHSHPDLITPDSLACYDHIFCLSPPFLEKIQTMGRHGELLIGGTAKRPPSGIQELSQEIVFVANGKNGKGRKIIQDLMSLGNRWIDRLAVWGEGWDGILPGKCVRGLYLDNEKLAGLYASARVVLNDHHEDMRREGFLNPRILDVMASGGVVVSDALAGTQEIFGNALLTYSTPAELDHMLERLFQDSDYRTQISKAGVEIVQSYSFKSVARKIIQHMESLDEDQVETRVKNLYMRKVWAPVKGQMDTDRIRRLKEITAEQCEGVTLDVGCANGDSTAIMFKHNPSLDLTGLELTEWGFSEACRHHQEIKFVQGDAKKLPFADQSFDTVVLDHIIEHFSDPVAPILEAKRVARKRVVIGIPLMHLNDPDHKIAWRLDDFKNLLLGFFPDFSVRGMREPDGVEVSDTSEWNFAVGTGFLERNSRKEVPLLQPLKLHLGCGLHRLPGFLNIDIMPSSAVDLQCDSRRLPLRAGSVSRIDTYHMIEHLPRHDFIEGLFEWNRVLAEGGTLMIECPDFDATVREYLEGKNFRINSIFGLQRHPGDFHLFGYTFESLREILQSLGFRDIRPEPPTDYHAADEPSLRLTAVKVHAIQRPADVRGISIQLARRHYAQAIESEREQRIAKSAIPEGPLRLDICGGEYPYGNGFLNVDVRPLPKVDIVADVTKGLHFADETVDEILSCGTLEHFYIPTVMDVLKEMRRVLKRGGKLTVGVPNLNAILSVFGQGEMDFQLFNQYIFGSVQKDNNPYNVHRSLWDADHLVRAMEEAGFTNVEEQPYDLPFHIPKYMLKVVGFAS